MVFETSSLGACADCPDIFGFFARYKDLLIIQSEKLLPRERQKSAADYTDFTDKVRLCGGVTWYVEIAPARISPRVFTAAADPGMSTALRSVGFLNGLSSTPVESSLRAPCIHARLLRLATKPWEKCGLACR